MFMTSGLLLCLLWCAVDIVAVNRGFGLNTKQGAHNRTNFMAELNSRGGCVKSETQTDIEGITRIKYEIPTLDRTGKPDGGFKEISSIKTVYDPKKFSDDKILQMAQKATSQGYSKASKIAQNERTKSISERKMSFNSQKPLTESNLDHILM